jgi:uncharacterized protein
VSLASEIAGRMLGLPDPQTLDIEVERDLRIEMEDGVVLLADRYAPRGAGPMPTILVRSPYGRSGVFGLINGRLFAERGLQVLVQSVRGTSGSGGSFAPFDERSDGLATIDWIKRRPWFGGRLAMSGASYLGIVQWAVAADAGDDLDALALTATASRAHGQAFGGGSLALETAVTWSSIIAAGEQRLGMARLFPGLRRLPRLLDELPIAELDAAATGRALPFYAEWMQHTEASDPYWAERDFSTRVAEVAAPAQFVGGWFDIFLPWMLEDYAALQAAGRDSQLIIGPWAHTSPGMLAAGTREALAWLRAHLLEDPRLLDEAPVRIFVGGVGEWRRLQSWPPKSEPLRLHLQPRGGLAAEPAPPSRPDSYRYDPSSPTPSLGGPGLLVSKPVLDNRPLEARPDVLTYTTEPLVDDIEVIGPVSAEIHLRSNIEHLDLFVRVCDVLPGGESMNVCDALERLVPGAEGRARPAEETRVVRLELWPTAHRFPAGHRIRVQISSGAHPRYARNPGTGEDLARATRLIASEQQILHGPDGPSALVLPHVSP